MFLRTKITVAVMVLLAVTVTTYTDPLKETLKYIGVEVDCSETDMKRMEPCVFYISSKIEPIRQDILQCRFDCSYLDTLMPCLDQAGVRDICSSTFKENSHIILIYLDDILETNCTNFKNLSSIEEICPKPPIKTGLVIGLAVASGVLLIAIATGVFIHCHWRKPATVSGKAVPS